MAHGFLQNCAKPEGRMGKLVVRMMNSAHTPLSKWGLAHLELAPDADVIDLGCGGGSNVSAMLEACPAGHVTGFDYSPVSVEASKKKNAAAIDEGRCSILEGDVAELPFSDYSFYLHIQDTYNAFHRLIPAYLHIFSPSQFHN